MLSTVPTFRHAPEQISEEIMQDINSDPGSARNVELSIFPASISRAESSVVAGDEPL